MQKRTMLMEWKKSAYKALAVIIFVLAVFLMPQNAGDVIAAGSDSMKYSNVIAHGGGTVDGFVTSNSAEAVAQSASAGIDLIELDLSLTSDGYIVMLHDWDRTTLHYLGEKLKAPVPLKEFERYSILGALTPLTMDGLLPLLDQYPGIKIITDTKDDTLKILALIAERYPEYRERFIPQIYGTEQYGEVKDLGYDDIILTLYLMENPDPSAIAEFAMERELFGVTMPDYVADKGLLKEISSWGVDVFVHPIATFEEANKYFDMGAKKVYASNLTSAEFKPPQNTHYLKVKEKDDTYKKLVDETFQTPVIATSQALTAGEHPFQIGMLEVSGLREGEKAELNLTAPVDGFLGKTGAWEMSLDVFNESGVKKSGTPYILLQKDDRIRILQEKARYRLNAMKLPKNFEDISTYKEAENLLRNSFIAQKGESVYYDCGEGKIFKNGEDRLAVTADSMGHPRLPMADTFRALGAESVTMTADGAAILVTVEEEEYRIPVGSLNIRKGISLIHVKNPITIYLQKAMATGETFGIITQRPYVESEGLLIILPKNTAVNKNLQEDLVKAAQTLF